MKDEYKDLLDEHKRSGKMKSIAIIGESNPADIADYILDNNNSVNNNINSKISFERMKPYRYYPT